MMAEDTAVRPAQTAHTCESWSVDRGKGLRATGKGTAEPAKGHRVSDPIQQTIRQAEKLLRLPRGWNSYCAKPISSDAVSKATAFLLRFDALVPNLAAPAVVPTVRGGLQLEWHGQGVDIEVEFGSGDPDSWSAEDEKAVESLSAPLARHENAIRRWLNRVSGHQPTDGGGGNASRMKGDERA